MPSQYNPRHSSINNTYSGGGGGGGRDSGDGRGSYGNDNNRGPTQSKALTDAYKSVRRSSANNNGGGGGVSDVGMRATTYANQAEPADL